MSGFRVSILVLERLGQDPSWNAAGSQRIPELQALLEEKDKHIETLKTENEGLKQDKEDLKETHKNYMIQMQTLINQKAIEVPGEKKPWW
ncbi:MAG: hypothetical protein EHM20_15785 [Alphaproteobacteria bacterium]|nr:MAG: hypothetical protein EHM20_15785 [Alphaproteobacteria bacterium]